PAGIVVEGPERTRAALTLDERLPSTLFVFPLRKSVPFPNLMMPVLLDSPESRDIVARAEAGNGHILLLTLRDAEKPPQTPEDFYQVGVIARILKTLNLPDGNASVMVQGRARARVSRFVRKPPHALVKVTELVDVPSPGKRGEAAFRELRDALRKVGDLSDQLGDEFTTAVLNIDSPEQLADFTGAYLLKKTDERQQILETVEVG